MEPHMLWRTVRMVRVCYVSRYLSVPAFLLSENKQSSISREVSKLTLSNHHQPAEP
jgi:hypothetical protein